MTTTDRRQGVNAGLAMKAPCRVATTAAITLSGEQTIDGVACVTGDRVLVKNQSSSVDNGIYVVDSSAWDRALDCDGTLDLMTGTAVYVFSGTANIGFWYVSTVDAQIVPGTDVMDWADTGAAQPAVKVIQSSRDISLTTAQAITGIGFTPRNVYALAGVGASVLSSWGFSDATSLGCIYNNGGAISDTNVLSATELIRMAVDGSNYSRVTGVAFASGSCTLTWAKTGTPTGTADLMLMFRR
jgi:hypothetical protein